jgi:hypothetical protein
VSFGASTQIKVAMKLTDGVARVEIAVTEVAEPIPPHSAGGDVRLQLGLTCDGFMGTGSSWIARDVWQRFLRELEHVEDRREGEAAVESMSPGELRLRICVTDRAGHVAVNGQVRTPAFHDVRWQFGAIQFDPSLLPPLLAELRAAGQAR